MSRITNLLQNAELMLRPIGESSWTRQAIVDHAKENRNFVLLPEHDSKPMRKVLRELCGARILYCTTNKPDKKVYIMPSDLRQKLRASSDGANPT
jgi:siroheme synthase (precorrin-2 oxidase/ferrochelatase)